MKRSGMTYSGRRARGFTRLGAAIGTVWYRTGLGTRLYLRVLRRRENRHAHGPEVRY